MSAYGLWSLILINSAIFIIFAFSFTHPRTNRDRRSFGAFSAFIVALFTEMYGFPLTIYLLSGWLGKRYPILDPFSHDAGHLWHTLLGMKGNPHLDPFHILSNVLIFGGLIFLASAWDKLYRAQREHKLDDYGPIRLRPASAIRRVHRDHVWLPASVAHVAYARNVSSSSLDVRSSQGGAGCAQRIW